MILPLNRRSLRRAGADGIDYDRTYDRVDGKPPRVKSATDRAIKAWYHPRLHRHDPREGHMHPHRTATISCTLARSNGIQAARGRAQQPVMPRDRILLGQSREQRLCAFTGPEKTG